jgi:dethiobiotin synthetase
MKQFFFGLAACGLAAVLPAQAASVAAAKLVATSNTDETAAAANSDPSLCLDSMETVPDDDDLAPTPASVDGGCSVSTDTIST